MANVQAVRQALASQLAEHTGITAHANMPGQITPPMIAVLPGSPYISYGQTMGESEDAFGASLGDLGAGTANASKNSVMLVVLVVVSLAVGYESMQPVLDNLLEPAGNNGSIPTAIALDETLGGTADFAVPLDITGYGLVNVASQDYFGAHMRVQVGA